MKKIIFTTILVFFISGLLPWNESSAQVKLTISKKFGERIRMAVPPFSGNSYKAQQLSSQVEKYLDFSGFFQSVANSSFVSDQHNQDMKNGFIDFKGWQAITAEILIKGKANAFGDSMDVEFEVFSTSDQKRIFGKGLRGKSGDLSFLACTIADEILAKLTGNPPVFSKKIAFTTNYYKVKTVVISDFSGENRVRLFTEAELSTSPRWFFGEDKLLYVSYRKKNPAIYLLDLEKRADNIVIHFPGLNVNPDISGNNRFVTFTASRDGNPEIYVKDISSGNYLRVTESRAVDGDPAISPDGKSVAFVSNRYGTPQIFIQEGASRLQRITWEGRYNTSPSWSPKGDMIAYASQTENGFDIYVYDIKEQKSFPVVESRGNDDNPDWSADGRHLVFQSDRTGTSNIYAVDIFTRQEIQITKSFGDCETPSWQK